MPLHAGARLGTHEIVSLLGAGGWVKSTDLPASAVGLAGFSLHPDGSCFATSLGLWPSDVWMLEGFDRRQCALPWPSGSEGPV